MMSEDEERTFRVVANHEEQYSIWPEHKEVPEGWVAVGPQGSKEECLDYIEHVWTDMRPRSLRVAMRDSSADSGRETPGEPGPRDEIRSLVESTLSRYERRVDEYADGRPELFGWFLARVLELLEGDTVDPDVVRAHLHTQLPDPHIPDEYA